MYYARRLNINLQEAAAAIFFDVLEAHCANLPVFLSSESVTTWQWHQLVCRWQIVPIFSVLGDSSTLANIKGQTSQYIILLLFCAWKKIAATIHRKCRLTSTYFVNVNSANQRPRSLWKVGAASDWSFVDICCLHNKTIRGTSERAKFQMTATVSIRTVDSPYFLCAEKREKIQCGSFEVVFLAAMENVTFCHLLNIWKTSRPKTTLKVMSF